jgi:hypothetical protein
MALASAQGAASFKGAETLATSDIHHVVNEILQAGLARLSQPANARERVRIIWNPSKSVLTKR